MRARRPAPHDSVPFARPAATVLGRRAAAGRVLPLSAVALAAAAVARATTAPAPVGLLLVLATDASGSMDADEFRLQREGIAEGLSHPAVLAAVASRAVPAVGVALVEWGSPGGAQTVLGWARLDGRDPASARALAGAVLAAPRSRQSWNAIGDALDHAAALMEAAPWRGVAERVVDVSGDAPDMRSLRPVEAAREDAAAAGITVNALAISTGGRPGLAEAYRRTVVAGPGAFVVEAEGREDFARALRAKLVREVA